jgi:hypothetical protein
MYHAGEIASNALTLGALGIMLFLGSTLFEGGRAMNKGFWDKPFTRFMGLIFLGTGLLAVYVYIFTPYLLVPFFHAAHDLIDSICQRYIPLLRVE